MAEVSLDIGGRNYDVTCRDGEEDHLRTIAQLVDRKANDARQAVGGVNEARQLLFAALLLADELVDARRAAPAEAGSPPPAPGESAYPLMAETLEQLAERIEAVLGRLEGEAETP